jgi:hypothetical protein
MAILSNQKVLTLDYWKPASNLKPGDYVFDKDGKIVQIKLVQEYRAQNCYEVMFNDYLTIAGDQHLGFLVETPRCRTRQATYKGVKKFRRPLQSKTVSAISDSQLRDKRNRLTLSVPTTKPLTFPEQDLPVPPFLFGFWFFNQRKNKTMAAPPGMSKEIYEQFKDFGYQITESKKLYSGEREFSVFPTIESHLLPNIPNRIPNNYLLASTEQRIQLLRGILYAKSRQYSKSKDKFRLTTKHYAIILQLQCLLESLGHKLFVFYDTNKKYYTIFFKSRLQLVSNQTSPRIKVHHTRRYIKKIEPIASQMCVHIETTGSDNTILVGEGFIACR